MAGMLFGSGMASLVTTTLDQPSLMSWGWRLPFLLAGIPGYGGRHLEAPYSPIGALSQAGPEKRGELAHHRGASGQHKETFRERFSPRPTERFSTFPWSSSPRG